MKKITFFIMMLVGITAFAQVEVVENFDTTAQGSLPTGWTTSQDEYGINTYQVITYNQCGGSGGSVLTGTSTDYGLPPYAFSYTLTSPNYPSITNDTDLTVSFSINVFEETGPWPPINEFAPTSDWGNVVLEYTVDGGMTWLTAATVNPSDVTYTSINACTTIPAVNLGALTAGNDFQARFVTNITNMSDNRFRINVILDNVSLTQVATTAPNCNATLVSPTNGSTGTDLDATITWQAATGLPTGYKVSIGTTSGGTDILNEALTSDLSYSLVGLGLVYSTEYFVNIVPYNGIGDATGCTEESFTTRDAPIAGATCSNPIVIPSIPYFENGMDTSLSENNITEGPCFGFASAYLNGPDVIYSYTPATDESINIALGSVDAFGSSIHVFNGCGDDATECVASLGDNNYDPLPHNLELNEVVLFAGNTYTIVLSNSSSSYQYSLVITQNACINPEFTLSTTEDCANDQFYIDVDVTYLGDASGLTLSDGVGTPITGITTTGVQTVGPYATGTTVDLTLTNEDNGDCSYTDSIFYYCPPSNDDCSGAMDLTSTINTDDTCTVFTSATNGGGTEDASNPITCDFTGDNDVWFSFVASSETMILEYLNVTIAIGDWAGNQSTEVLEGSCGTFTSLGCFTNTNYVTLNNLTVNDTYYLRNTSSGSGAQNFDICLKDAPAPPANDECANATVLTLSTDDQCDNQASGTTVGATPTSDDSCNTDNGQNYKGVWYVFTPTADSYYEFSFAKTGTSSAYYYIYSGTCGALVGESQSCYQSDYNNQVLYLNSGESYYVIVRSADNGPGIDFDLCVWQLPPAAANDSCSAPTVLLESADATGNNAVINDFANTYASSENTCNSTNKAMWYSFTPSYTGMYHFDFTQTNGGPNYVIYNTDDCSMTDSNDVVTPNCWNWGDTTPELVAGNTYLVAIYNWDNLGAFELAAYPDATLSVESNNFETFKYFPNPVVNTLTVEAKNTISSISVFNILGQQVQTIEPNSLTSVIDMNELKEGMYFVNVTINNTKKTIKVIKE